MTTDVLARVNQLADRRESECGSIRRTPFYLPCDGESVFAWLHEPAGDQCLDRGVIICPPIGYEQLHSHRALRHLADRLAIRSIPTLRFDWHGTGDSSGTDEDPNRYSRWLADIQSAVHWMREEHGCHRVSLVGLRMGATLATLATSTCEVDDLVLWVPVSKGRTYVREMKAIELTSSSSVDATENRSSDIEAAGFVLTSETASDLSQIDLAQCPPKCQRALVIARSDLAGESRLCEEWKLAGVHVEEIACPGFSEMMAEPHHTQVPTEGIRDIVSWLSNSDEMGTSQSFTQHVDERGVNSSLMIHRTTESTGETSEHLIRESTFTVDSIPSLFGIVSEPVVLADDELPVVVVLNSGSAYRIGPGRLAVFQCRHFASLGYRCVRLDLGGIGDSPCETPERENDPYPSTAFRDIDRAMDAIIEQYGAKRIVLMGLCSGAYDAFQSAVQMAQPALVEAVVINPLTFFWKDGMTLDTAPSKQLKLWLYYASAAIQPRMWLKLLSGKSKTGIVGVLRLVLRRLKMTKVSLPKSSADISVTSPRLGHPAKEDLPNDLKQIAKTGRRLAMFFAKSDPGFSILNFHARRETSRQRAEGRMTIEFIDDADHTFSTRSAKADLIAAIAKHLSRRYQG